jgi:hypothetical protein
MPLFGSAKWFWPSIFAQDAAELTKGTSKPNTYLLFIG